MTLDGTESSQPTLDPLAARLRGFGPIGILATLGIVALGPAIAPLAAVLALAWARRSGTPFGALGYVRPRSWIVTVAAGVVFGGVFKLLMKSVVMPLLGAPAINPAFHYLMGNSAALPLMLFNVTVVAGFGEETVYRGFLFERLGSLFGRGVGAKIATVLLTSAFFAVIHYPVQGLAGAEQAAFTGLVFGTIFAITGRIWFVMFAHAAFDLVALMIIYWDMETYVAHFFFQ
jgi:hypothetical protein